MKKYIWVIIPVVLLISLLLFLTSNISLELTGDTEISIPVNTEYQELGYSAKSNKKEINDKVEIQNNIDNKKIGTYEIVYKLKKGLKTIVKKRKVNIIDNEAPVISLVGNKTIDIYVNDKYQELGYTAIDNYDQDITDKVEIKNDVDISKEGTYELEYLVSDSSNNTATIKRIVNVKKRQLVSNSKIPVLMYHFFYDSNVSTGPDNNWMEISKFEEQIKYLKDNNYYFPTWQEINDYLDKKISLPEKSIVITSDDGNKSFFELAYPILEKHGVKATSFIVTSWVTPEDKYSSNILSYQSHSHDMHRGGCKGGHGGIFQCLDENKAYDDLITSKKLANDAMVFCYPFGDVTDNEVALVKKAGYSLAFTTASGKISPGMDKLRLPRVRISAGITLDGFKNAIK